MLTKYPKLQIEVAGHTDNVGSEAYNQSLSDGRAAAVMDYLIEPGLRSWASRLTSKRYGESMAKADNNTADGRKLQPPHGTAGAEQGGPGGIQPSARASGTAAVPYGRRGGYGRTSADRTRAERYPEYEVTGNFPSAWKKPGLLRRAASAVPLMPRHASSLSTVAATSCGTFPEGLGDQLLLLQLVAAGRSGGRAWRTRGGTPPGRDGGPAGVRRSGRAGSARRPCSPAPPAPRYTGVPSA